MGVSIPRRMLAVLLEAGGAPLIVGSVPVPSPGPGEVLVRVAASPINPSDLAFATGSYGFKKPFPVIPGFEGSGTVVAAGPGLLPRLWLGRRVTCSAPTGGLWAEYVVVSAASAVPLMRHVSLQQGATLMVNPMTAMAFFDIAKRNHHRAIISNAAASALGRMVLRLGDMNRIPVIHVVRREVQVELLRSLGAVHVLNSSEPDFHDQLHGLSHQLSATLILEPVAGEQAQGLLDAAPHGSTMLVYGALSGQRLDLESQPAMSDGRTLQGFFLPDWVATTSTRQALLDMWRVQRLATRVFETAVQARLPLSAVQEGVELSRANPTAGKVLLVGDSLTNT